MKQTDHVKKNRLWTRSVLLSAIILIGTGLRLYGLGVDSLWYDETVSAYLANLPPAELIAHTAKDIHPPGYYLLLHFWRLLAGQTEFVLAFFSFFWGVLLIPLTYRLARYITSNQVASWAALLLAISPFNVWYSQEVRMYTLGALLGVLSTYCLLRAVASNSRRFWLGYCLAAAAGLYVLYYFVFLLITINIYIMLRSLRQKPLVSATGITSSWIVPRKSFQGSCGRLTLRLVSVNLIVLLFYLPWLPIAWQQATNPPVPPWRSMPPFRRVLLESWTALVLGQSVAPGALWPLLVLALGLTLIGAYSLTQIDSFQTTVRHAQSSRRTPDAMPQPAVRLNIAGAGLLLIYTFGTLLLIYLLSFLTPLYHVRYLVTYSPAFYILLGAGLAWLSQRVTIWSAVIAAVLILVGSSYSLYQFHINPIYGADDFRSAVAFIQERWQPGDAILINAGYTYPAFLYYTGTPVERQRLVPYQAQHTSDQPLLLEAGTVDGPPTLGWNDPQADFYAASAAETKAALEKLAQDYGRLWQLRAYDTVTDPTGLIRQWLADQAIPLEDQLVSGESNIRAQGFLFPSEAPNPTLIPFEDGLVLAGWSLPQQSWQAGQTIPVKLWWSIRTASASVDYKASLKLWDSNGELAAQGRDEWPGGTLYRSTAWSSRQVVYHPMSLTLPSDLLSGQYWLNVELYHPQTVHPLPRADTGEAAITLGQVVVQEPTSER